jgi:hypothetical protein
MSNASATDVSPPERWPRLNAFATWWRRERLCDALLAWADRYRWWFFVALAGIYLAGFNAQWRIQPDAALYLSLGRNLAEGRGYTYLGQPHHLVYPGWPWMLAGTFTLFGSRTLVPQHVLILLIAFATIALTYRLILLHSGRPTAVVIAVGVGVTKTFYGFGFELWTDLPFTLGVIAFLAGVEAIWPRMDRPHAAKWYDWILLVGGLALAYATRPMIWPLLMAVAAAAMYAAIRSHRRWALLAAGIALVAVVTAAFIAKRHHAAAPEIESEYERYAFQQASHLGLMLNHAVTVNLPSLLQLAAPDTIFQVRFGPFNIFLGLFVIALGVMLFRDRPLWGFWFVALLLTLVLILPLDRYFLPVIPLLVFAWWRWLVWLNRRLPGGWGNWAVLGLLGFAMGMNVSKVGGIVIQQHARPFLSHYSRGEFAAVPALAAEIDARLEPNAIVLVKAPYAHALSFLSRRVVVNGLGTAVTGLQGRPVYVVQPSDHYIDELLDQAKLRVTAVVWRAEPTTPSAGQLSLQATESWVSNAK